MVASRSEDGFREVCEIDSKTSNQGDLTIIFKGYRSSHIMIDLATTALHGLYASLLIDLPRAQPKTSVAALSASFEPMYLFPALQTKDALHDRPTNSCACDKDRVGMDRSASWT